VTLKFVDLLKAVPVRTCNYKNRNDAIKRKIEDN